jgi:hypothetical protein
MHDWMKCSQGGQKVQGLWDQLLPSLDIESLRKLEQLEQLPISASRSDWHHHKHGGSITIGSSIRGTSRHNFLGLGHPDTPYG